MSEIQLRPLTIRRRPETFAADHSRVIAKLFVPSSSRHCRALVKRIQGLPEAEVTRQLHRLRGRFMDRHRDLDALLLQHYDAVQHYVPNGTALSTRRRLLIGGYFTREYSVESAALFNPSIIQHPDQHGLAADEVRFIISFRATGEGHISSIEFRSGVIDQDFNIMMDRVSPYLATPELIDNPSYDNYCFRLKLAEMSVPSHVSDIALRDLPLQFTFMDMERGIKRLLDQSSLDRLLVRDAIESMRWLAHSNYQVQFNPAQPISERVIFPTSANEMRGIEDARFVRFVHEDGRVIYYATYTACDGIRTLPQLLETRDFAHFRIITLNGKCAQHKGLALFPRKVGDKYFMISRQDGENLFLASSDNLHFWHTATLLRRPEQPWELVQIGNCGSPIATEAGWLHLTHGVGPMRQYCIGIDLLDLHDPSKVIGHLKEPLIVANEEEREGYVPNVVYSCGGFVHHDRLIIPYAVSDSRSRLASVALDDLLSRLAP